MSNLTDDGKDKLRLFVGAIHATLVAEESHSLSDEELSRKCVDAIRAELGGERLYLPVGFARYQEIIGALQKNKIPLSMDEFNHHMQEHGGGSNRREWREEILRVFGKKTTVIEIDSALVLHDIFVELWN